MIDFSAPGVADVWAAVDDAVMGGVSESALRASPAGAVFAGHLSTDEGGGFASVRSPEGVFGFDGAAGLLLRLRGDGKRYYLRLYTKDTDAAYEAPFDAASEWTDLKLPFSEFHAVWRGRDVPGAPPLEPAHITNVGLMIKDEQVGEFRLELTQIEPYID